VRNRGTIGDYLYGIFRDYVPEGIARSKVIWDISTVASVVNPSWFESDLHPAPILLDDVTWGPVDPARHPIRIVRHIDRDAVYGDLFSKLERAARQA